MVKKPPSEIGAESSVVGAPPTKQRLDQALQPAAADSRAQGTAAGGPQIEGGRVASQPEEQTRRFYERLEQTGQLVDVDEKIDLSTLPSRVTHVRFPDGTVKRIGFS